VVWIKARRLHGLRFGGASQDRSLIHAGHSGAQLPPDLIETAVRPPGEPPHPFLPHQLSVSSIQPLPNDALSIKSHVVLEQMINATHFL
jgi:hypothetical protein